MANDAPNQISIIERSHRTSRSNSLSLPLGNLEDLPIDQIAQMAESNRKNIPTQAPKVAEVSADQESCTGTDDFILDYARYELSAEELESLQLDEKRISLYGKEFPNFAIVDSKIPVKKKKEANSI